jgi:photosynthetic reaction center cytochrome c subunit
MRAKRELQIMMHSPIAVALLLGWLTLVVGCDMPPMDSTQLGYRGTAMAEIDNPEDIALVEAANQAPAPLPIVPPAPGPKAKDIYQNVQVLGELSVGEFVGLMTAITQWVAPDEGCTYCHGENLADDGKYTKVVSRRMLEMTRHINAQWTDHVGDTGVTCYTCHRGKHVPEYIWFQGNDIPDTRGLAASRQGQNLAAPSVASASLPYDPFTPLIQAAEGEVKVAADTALPMGQTASMAATEQTYALMMHMSESLGVNCTHCHNSRAFGVWDQSTTARVTAWHGIRMARELNNDYLIPLQSTYPVERLGKLGDAPKANCSTCHQGVAKPLYGAAMAKDYPALTAYFYNNDTLLDELLAYHRLQSQSSVVIEE